MSTVTSPYVTPVKIDKCIIYIEMGAETGVEGELVFVPSISGDEITWNCKGSTVEEKYLPPECKQQ